MDYYDENDNLKSSEKEKYNRKRNKYIKNKKETYNVCFGIIIIAILVSILFFVFNKILNKEKNELENKIHKLNLEKQLLMQNNSLLIKENEHYKKITSNLLNEKNKYDLKRTTNKTHKIVAISYGDSKFARQLEFNGKSALEMAKVDEFYGYTPDDIDPEFKKKNEDILNRPRGNGYWLWKPYFLYRTLEEKLDYGDFLIYSDAGILYIDAAQKLVDFLNKKNTDMYLHRLPHLERQYTKRTAFILLGVDDPFYAETGQFNAAFQIYRKTKFTEYFLKEYLYYAQDKRIITDDSNEMGEENYPEFKDHRHDQSILSLLIKKYGQVNSNKTNLDLEEIKKYEEDMPTIFCHYRQRGVSDYDALKNMCKNVRGNIN